jgi:lysocardiolipin and lysophospholipid acyltransferase
MKTKGIRQRQPPATVPVIEKLKAHRTQTAQETTKHTEPVEPTEVAEKEGPDTTQHPGGEIKHGVFAQALRMFLFAAYFNGSIIALVCTQLIDVLGH